jgi:transcriptional regulator with XRE-family HTH domain
MGLSRHQLAEKIGVTHQQLQKYEKGINRISAGRLVAIANALSKPVSYFFEDVDSSNEADVLPNQHHRMCIEVSRNFLRIKNPVHQNAVNMLVRSLAENGVEDDASL